MTTVLVTGGSGFIGSHVLVQLLAAGYDVRTTVRNLQRESDVRAMLCVGGVEAGMAASGRIRFFAADLLSDAGWAEAAAGCEYVLHVASPLPMKVPKEENELIVPAREGTLRVLRAARDAGVKRVVLTSSSAAISYGHAPQKKPFTEADWTDLNGHVQPYMKSKTLAERAAWDFMAREGGKLELAVVNPVGVFGPVLGPDFSASIEIVKRLMDGTVPGCPRLSFGAVDVRDVVDMHLRAMTDPAAKGERFLAVAGDSISFLEIARLLKREMGEAGKWVPARAVPDWVLRLMAVFDPTVGMVVPELGKVRDVSNAKARRVLGWTPRSNEESILATAESLVRLGLLKHSAKRA
jgi:nucleoside-diphosphate-sugar epimerase